MAGTGEGCLDLILKVQPRNSLNLLVEVLNMIGNHFILWRRLLSQDSHRIKTSDNAPASLLSFKSKLRSRTPRTRRTRSAIQSASLLGFGAARMSRFDRLGQFGSGRMKKLPCPDLIHLLGYEKTAFEFKPAYFAFRISHLIHTMFHLLRAPSTSPSFNVLQLTRNPQISLHARTHVPFPIIADMLLPSRSGFTSSSSIVHHSLG